MTKYLLTLSVLSAGILGLAACAKSLPPGHYENTSSSTNAAGTKTTTEKNTDVYYDKYGNKRATVKTETTKDPKGLFNKQTTESTRTY